METKIVIRIIREKGNKWFGGMTEWYGKTIPTETRELGLAHKFLTIKGARISATKLAKELKSQIRLEVVEITGQTIIEVI